MSERSNEKQVSFFLDEKEREAFRLLCKTTGISVANVLRSWIQQALKEQRIENRKRLEIQIAKEDDFEKAKQLFEELKRVDELIERDYGIQAPDRDFTDLRVKKLSDDELRLREELQKGKKMFINLD